MAGGEPFVEKQQLEESESEILEKISFSPISKCVVYYKKESENEE